MSFSTSKYMQNFKKYGDDTMKPPQCSDVRIQQFKSSNNYGNNGNSQDNDVFVHTTSSNYIGFNRFVNAFGDTSYKK